MPWCLIPEKRTWNTSLGRRPGGILKRCPNQHRWLLSTQRNSSFNLSSSQMIELLVLSQRESSATLLRNPISATFYLQSCCFSRDHRWEWEQRLTGRSRLCLPAQLSFHHKSEELARHSPKKAMWPYLHPTEPQFTGGSAGGGCHAKRVALDTRGLNGPDLCGRAWLGQCSSREGKLFPHKTTQNKGVEDLSKAFIPTTNNSSKCSSNEYFMVVHC